MREHLSPALMVSTACHNDIMSQVHTMKSRRANPSASQGRYKVIFVSPNTMPLNILLEVQ